MLQELFDNPAVFFLGVLIRLPVILLALTVHEWAHGRTALKFGDPTAKLAGRLTFNPISHLDPLGFIMLIFGPIGWAKPVPVNYYNLRRPRQDALWVSFAGPASNICLALVLGLLFRLSWGAALAAEPQLRTFTMPFPMTKDAMQAVQAHLRPLALYWLVFLNLGILINLSLAFFNLIPLRPLDGSHVVTGLLPERAAEKFEDFQRYGPVVLILLLVYSWHGGLDSPIMAYIKFFASPLSWLFSGLSYVQQYTASMWLNYALQGG